MIHTQNHGNLTLVNNSFIDAVWHWEGANAILFEQFPIACPVQPFTVVKYTGNLVKSTVKNTQVPMIYFEVSLSL